MSKTAFVPFINWSDYTSRNANHPDVLHLQVAVPETFATLYTTNVRVYHKDIDGDWKEKILKLKSHDSANASLLKQWKGAEAKGLIEKNKHFKIRTWLGFSKRNPDREIRRFELDI